MNITFSVDEQVVKRARRAARAMGKSLNQVIREHLAQLSAADAPARDVEELRRLSAEADGHSRGWRFDRAEIHARS
jgi:hypothetical protein